MKDKQDLYNLTLKEIKLRLERILMEKQLYQENLINVKEYIDKTDLIRRLLNKRQPNRWINNVDQTTSKSTAFIFKESKSNSKEFGII